MRSFYIIISLFFVSLLPLHAQNYYSKSTFQVALKAFKNRDYYSARLLFQEILTKASRGEYADSSQYYLALTYFYEGDYKTTIFELKILEQEYSSSKYIPQASFYIAESYYFLKEFEKALRFHHDFLRRWPVHPLGANALYTTGYIYWELKKYDQAIAEFDRGINQFPESNFLPQLIIQKGITQYTSGIYKDARKTFQKLIVKYPKSSRKAQFWIAQSWFAEKKYKEARRELDLILEKSSTNELKAKVMYLYARLHFELKEWKKAKIKLEYLDKKFHDWEMRTGVWFRLAQIYHLLNQDKKAILYLNKFRNIPENEYAFPAFDLLAEIYIKKKSLQALSALDLALKAAEKKNIPKILKRKADYLYKLNRFEESIEVYRKLSTQVKRGKLSEEIEYQIAASFFNQDKLEKSQKLLLEMLKKYPRSLWRPEVYYLLGEIYFLNLEYSKSLKEYQKVVRFYPKSRVIYKAMLGVGWSYFELKQYARASDVFQKLISQNPPSEISNKANLAWASCLYNLRDFDLAEEKYNLIIRNSQVGKDLRTKAVFQKAWLFYRTNQNQKAVLAFNLFIKKFSEESFDLTIKAYYFRGWSFFRLGNYSKSQTDFDQVIKKGNGDLKRKSVFDLARSQIAEKKLDTAIITLKKYLDDYPQGQEREEVWYELGKIYLDQSNPNQANLVATSLRKENKKSFFLSELYYEISRYWERKNNFEKAQAILNEVISNSVESDEKWQAKIEKAKIAFRLNKEDLALKHLDAILIVASQDAIEYQEKSYLLILQYYESKKKFNALLNFVKTHPIKRFNKDIRYELSAYQGRAFLEVGSPRKAIKTLLRVVSNSSSEYARYYLAVAYLQENNLKNAEKYFKKLSRIQNSQFIAPASYKLGEIYLIYKRYEDAIKEYAKIIYLYSSNDELYEKSLFRSAFAFKKIGKIKNYEKMKSQLIELFPNSSYLSDL